MHSSSRQRPGSLGRMALAWAFALGLFAGPASAQVLRWAPQAEGSQSLPVSVFADEIAGWKEDGHLVFLLRGKVLVENGSTTVRFDRGVLWIDEQARQRSGVYSLRLYGEGGVFAESGPANGRAEEGVLLLRTRASVKVKQQSGSIERKVLVDDPLYQRGRGRWAAAGESLPATPEVAAAERPDLSAPGENAVAFRPAAAEAAPPPEIRLTAATSAGPGLQPVPFPESEEPEAPPPIPEAPPEPQAAAAPNPLPLLGKLPTLPFPTSTREQSAAPRQGPVRLVGGESISAVPPTVTMQPPVPEGGAVPPPPAAGAPPAGPGLFGQGFGGGFGGRGVSIRPRSTFQGIQQRIKTLPTGETAVIVTGGIILTVTNADGKGGLLDIEADRVVLWTTGTPQQILEDLRTSKTQENRPMEFYLSGNVEIRTQIGVEKRLMRADEVYYDVNRNVAIATKADLEIFDPRLLNPIHVEGDEILQLNKNLFRALDSEVNASALPYDPGFRLIVREGTLETKNVPKRGLFGRIVRDPATGQPVEEQQRYFKGNNVFVYLEDVPVFYLPFVQGDVEDPLGPLQNISVGYNRIFGFQLYTTWDMFDLIGLTRPPGSQWRLKADALTDRGPALGSDYLTGGSNLFGIPNYYRGQIVSYGIYDQGQDVIGGERGRFIRVGFGAGDLVPVTHPDWRGRFTARGEVQGLPYGFMGQAQLSAISDKNFMEQFFVQEWQNGLNQDTYLYVKQQSGNAAWTGKIQPRIRPWITQTERLPEFEGYLLGYRFWDLVTYNAKASAGYLRLLPTSQAPFITPPPVSPPYDFFYGSTDQQTSAGRFDLWQEFSVPFPVGPVQLVPYGIVDLTYYTQDLTGNDAGRVYGGGGLRASMPFSRLYPGVYSELFNLDGLYHKIVLSANYYNAYSNVNFERLPQFDRFNDDASDQALRNLYYNQPFINPQSGYNLIFNPLFDEQVFALRNLVFQNIDTRDDIQALQLGVRQRWQTKRGFPGRQHIIDWMTLDLQGTIFPQQDRDNFGELFGLLQYDWRWNIGDRTSLVSSGWGDPIGDAARVFNIGADYNRPDNTTFYLGYRQIDPLNSKAVVASTSYFFSRKYSATGSATYDFGVGNQTTTVALTRYGKDLRVSLGVSYNSLLNNFGLVFEILPNLLPVGGLRGPSMISPYGTVASDYP